MTRLEDYHHFAGRHWETGSVHNYYAYRGITAPHTGQPYSEALLMGISGGAVMAYFSFAYQGYDPHVALLTRNTFDPLNTLLERLGVVQDIRQTSKPERAVRNLEDILDSGLPALTWADVFSMPYNALYTDKDMWLMYPIVVYGYEPEEDRVWIADRALVPLTITTGELAAVRGRVKQDKHRLLTLSPPDAGKLPGAVQKGLWDCIKLYTEAPPKGSRENFGFAAYQRWVKLLQKPKEKQSWERVFPPGRPMYAGLVTTYRSISQFSDCEDAERETFAAFLDEAAIILDRPALKQAGELFRKAGNAWTALAHALLPDEIPPFGETRRLIRLQQKLFREQGAAALPEMKANNARLEAILHEMESAFPLDAAGVQAQREALSERIMAVHDIELEAVKALQEAVTA